VLVALAFTGGMPTNNSVGKEMKLPPPATELTAPAVTAAANKMGQCATCIKKKTDITSLEMKPEEYRTWR
jgi:hypothetical protein